ncbi:MAG TPA: hypothetical protein VK936_01400 [Longimicrobiales bacterium]|nr:hypothetical protein [Longimicrobiales bacterium]
MLEKRFYGERVRRYTDMMARVLYDAYGRLDAEREKRGMDAPAPGDVDILSWSQSWPDACCGFDRPIKDALPSEQTDVVIDNRLGIVYVYHAGQLARWLHHPGESFWTAVRERRLPAAVDEEAWLQLT